MSALAVTITPGGVRFAVRVKPRASRTEVSGIHGTALKVRLLAPPVDGAANDLLIEYLAESLGVTRRSVRIVSGRSSRSKIMEVDGVTPQRTHALASQSRARD